MVPTSMPTENQSVWINDIEMTSIVKKIGQKNAPSDVKMASKQLKWLNKMTLK